MITNDICHWENFLFGLFTSELELSTFFDELSGQPDDKSLGFIFPSARTLHVLQNATIGLLGESPCIALAIQFENEVSTSISKLTTLEQRILYLERMKARFKSPFSLIPTYSDLCEKMFESITQNLTSGKHDFAYYSLFSQFVNLIKSTQSTIESRTKLELNLSDSHLDFLDQNRVNPTPKSTEQRTRRETDQNYFNWAMFYCRRRAEFQEGHKQALSSTARSASKSQKTIMRALKKHQDMLDKNKISF